MFLPFNGAGDPFVVPQDERAFPTELVARLKQIVAWQADELNICLKVIARVGLPVQSYVHWLK